jgi:hypothetical protein
VLRLPDALREDGTCIAKNEYTVMTQAPRNLYTLTIIMFAHISSMVKFRCCVLFVQTAAVPAGTWLRKAFDHPEKLYLPRILLAA